MAKITIQSIQEQLESLGWKVISDTYKNLDEELEFQCNEGHKVFTTWKKLRNKTLCPICGKNQYKINDVPILKKKKGVKRILALDQASHITGYALFENKSLIKWGTFETKSNSEDARVNEVKEWLASKINGWELDYIGLEGIQYQESFGVTTFQTLARLQGVLINLCFEQGIRYEICPTNTWRHHCGVKGRSLPNDMLIPTLNGQKKVGEIKVGDKLISGKGEPTTVLKCYPQGELPVWEITFADGRKIECSKDHLWSYHTYRQREKAKKERKFITSTTEELYNKGYFSGNSNLYNLLVPYCYPVQYPKKNFEIPPYVMGAFLGDGTFRLGKETSRPLQFSSKDSILPNKIGKIMNWIVKHPNNTYIYYFYDPFLKKNVQIKNFLKNYPELINTSSKEKFIPEDYLYGSVEQRICLMQGLFDTDGCASGGRVRFTTISKKLAEQVQQLSYSLGLSSTIIENEPRGFGKEKSYSVSVYGNPQIKQQLFTLEYKKEQVKFTNKRQFNTNAIIDIRPTKILKPMTCFLVDNEEHLFLAKDYIVTHNTRSDKKRSMQILIKQWYDISVSDDVADALGIGKYITDTYMPTVEIVEWE